jgi:hypothetical protein
MCFTLRLHMSATPPRVGLTQALGPMRKFFRYFLVILCIALLLGCNAKDTMVRSHGPDITLEQAKDLIVSGKVREIFQPHQGCVILTMNDGHLLSFNQPHLDWIYDFVKDKGLLDSVPVSME